MGEIATSHRVSSDWDRVTGRIREEIALRGVHAARTVVLVPYAQLMPVARSAWGRCGQGAGPRTHVVPRFETTMNWTTSLAGFEPDGDDLRLDAARDALAAASLLERAGLGAHAGALAGRLMEAAWTLARPAAAAVEPTLRSQWGARLAAGLAAQGTAPALERENQLGLLALAWAANSAYRTDVLFGAQADLLVLLEGLQPERLHEALREVWGERAVSIRLNQPGESGLLALHRSQDPEDEAECAAALANLRALLAASLQLAGGRYATPYAFVRALKAGGVRAPASMDDQAVRLFTIHGAKGLEAEMVALLDTDTPERAAETMGVLIDWPGQAARPNKFVFWPARASHRPARRPCWRRNARSAGARSSMRCTWRSHVPAIRW